MIYGGVNVGLDGFVLFLLCSVTFIVYLDEGAGDTISVLFIAATLGEV